MQWNVKIIYYSKGVNLIEIGSENYGIFQMIVKLFM